MFFAGCDYKIYSLSFFSISRKYLYVSTVISPQASSSQAMIAALCI
ncbi:MAG: hypothetical protein II399_01025 [Lachnospiraceae bacterium]|nr:hypothetical protein [Lachnospiraceae bacterium]